MEYVFSELVCPFYLVFIGKPSLSLVRVENDRLKLNLKKRHVIPATKSCFKSSQVFDNFLLYINS